MPVHFHDVMSIETSGLPRWSTFYNKEIIYDRKGFLDSYKDVSGQEKEQVKKQIGHLAEFGGRYASLDTHPLENELPHTPKGSFYSAVSDRLRVTWSIEREKKRLVIHALLPRGHIFK